MDGGKKESGFDEVDSESDEGFLKSSGVRGEGKELLLFTWVLGLRGICAG